MDIAVLLMAGSSQRLGGQTPKQFIEVDGKKVYQYCLDTFYHNDGINKIILVTNHDSVNTVKFELTQIGYDKKRIDVISGDSTRTKSLKKALNYINQNKWMGNIITHDIARALVSDEIINKHVSLIDKNNNVVINTYLESTDTLSTTKDGKLTILDRSKIIRHQTPQTISINNLNKVFDNLSEREWESKTDLCDLCNSSNLEIVNVLGNDINFKITTLADLDLFKYYVNKKKI